MLEAARQAKRKMVANMRNGKYSNLAVIFSSKSPKQNGFTMLAVLAAMFLSALAANAVMLSLAQQDTREREAQLLQIGIMYRQAIKDYYEMSPGAVKQWPKTLSDLAHDLRFVDLRRHIREVYDDPITRSDDWGLIFSENGSKTGISGMYSKSIDQPLNTAAVSFAGFDMPSVTQYAQRRFEYIPPAISPSDTPPANSPKAAQ
jgi:type II secretory pathway pseudopilin PulG